MILWAPFVDAQVKEIAHEFVYRADREHRSVFLAGSFNGWSPSSWPMKGDADARTWRYAAKLSPGRHYYKFVLDGSTWITDPKAVRNEDDGNGNTNSVLDLLPNGMARPGKTGDGSVNAAALKHLQEAPWVNWDQGRLTLQFQTLAQDAKSVFAVVQGKRTPMRRVGTDGLFDRYSAEVPWDRKAPVRYSFALEDGGTTVAWVGKGGSKDPSFKLDPKSFRPIMVPNWVEKTVLYQIFPERFDNGDPSNDHPNKVAWDAKPQYYTFHGGDLAGVRKHLGYLKSLGIGTVYFNPIFEGPSNHHYETFDYYKVDPHLGTNAELASLTKDLHAAGIKVILDGVFNHSGTGFAPFKDVVASGEASKFKNWFFINSYPVVVKDPPNYRAFYNFPSLPAVNLLDPDASAYMLKVPGFWERTAKIDGWRLDTAQDAPMEFWRRFRKAVKGIRSDKWILGENWGDSSPWLKGDQWDAAMNYPFRDAVLRFVAQGDIRASDFLKRLQANYDLYVPQVSRNMMNLLSSHDTPRFYTLCRRDPKLAAMGAVVQFAWAGTPSVYYGEELGMEGERDPDNRRGMVWSLARPDNPMLQLYRKLIAARRSTPVLQSGAPVPLEADDAKSTASFARVLGDDLAVAIVNRSDAATEVSVPLLKVPVRTFKGKQFQDVLSGRRYSPSARGSLSITLEAKGSALLVPTRPHSAVRANSVRHDRLGSDLRDRYIRNSRSLEAQ